MQNKEILSFFKNHPDVLVFFFTADGQCFFNENEAQHNAWAIKDEKITAITREEADHLDPDGETNLATVVEVVETQADFTQATPADAVPATTGIEAAAKTTDEPVIGTAMTDAVTATTDAAPAVTTAKTVTKKATTK